MWAGIVVTQLAWIAALAGLKNPARSAGVILAWLAATAIMVQPLLGIYLIATLLIGEWPWNLMRMLGIVTVISAGIGLLVRGKRIVYPSTLLLLTAAFQLLVVISAIHPLTRVDLRSEVLMYLGNGTLVWLLVMYCGERSVLLRIVRLMVFAGIVTAVIGVIQWRTHFTWIASTTRYFLAVDEEINASRTALDLQGWRGQFRADSVTGTPDYLALDMQVLMPFVALWLGAQRTWERKGLGCLALAALGAAHLLSFTRGALLTSGLVAFVLGWIVDKRRLLKWGPTVALVFAVMILSWGPLRERVLSIFVTTRMETSDREHTGGWRLRTIPVGFQMMCQCPWVGMGVGQQKWNWPASAIGDLIHDPELAEPLPIHNSYLLTGIELGFGGLAILLLLLGVSLSTLRRLRERFLSRNDSELALVATGLFVSMIGMSAAMLIYPMVGNFRYFWLLLGLTAALSRIDDEFEPPVEPWLTSTALL